LHLSGGDVQIRPDYGGSTVSRVPSNSTRRIALLGIAATLAVGFLTGSILTGVAAVAVTALILLASRGHRSNIRTGSRWRFMPLAAAALLFPLVWLTWGAAILLAPIGVALTIAALRRLPTWRDPVLLVGALANGLLGLGFLATLVTVAHDSLT
jgi:hypothetical protein